jgi:hypothetical protein
MGVKRMRPRGATRSLKAITCVNNTQNSQAIIAFVSTQVQRELSCNGTVVAAAVSSSSARGATAGTFTAPIRAAWQCVESSCHLQARSTEGAPRALRIIAMPSVHDARGDDGNRRPWPIRLPSKASLTS